MAKYDVRVSLIVTEEVEANSKEAAEKVIWGKIGEGNFQLNLIFIEEITSVRAHERYKVNA